MSDPFREPRFSPTDVRRIRRRATDIAERDPAMASAGKPMTRGEIERAAADLGLPADAIARAVDDGDSLANTTKAERSWLLLGAPTRLVIEREFHGEPSEADCEDVIEHIRDVVGDTGSIERVGKNLAWKTTTTNNQTRELAVRVRARDGRTRVTIEERTRKLAAGLFLGIGLGAGLGPMGGYIAAIIKFGPIAAALPLLLGHSDAVPRANDLRLGGAQARAHGARGHEAHRDCGRGLVGQRATPARLRGDGASTRRRGGDRRRRNRESRRPRGIRRIGRSSVGASAISDVCGQPDTSEASAVRQKFCHPGWRRFAALGRH